MKKNKENKIHVHHTSLSEFLLCFSQRLSHGTKWSATPYRTRTAHTHTIH